MEPDQEQLEQVRQLEQQLKESIAAEEFFNQATGILWTKLATEEITRITRDITSDKYLKDHVGYVNAVTELGAYKKILRKMQVAAAPKRRRVIRERLEIAGAKLDETEENGKST